MCHNLFNHSLVTKLLLPFFFSHKHYNKHPIVFIITRLYHTTISFFFISSNLSNLLIYFEFCSNEIRNLGLHLITHLNLLFSTCLCVFLSILLSGMSFFVSTNTYSLYLRDINSWSVICTKNISPFSPLHFHFVSDIFFHIKLLFIKSKKYAGLISYDFIAMAYDFCVKFHVYQIFSFPQNSFYCSHSGFCLFSEKQTFSLLEVISHYYSFSLKDCSAHFSLDYSPLIFHVSA